MNDMRTTIATPAVPENSPTVSASGKPRGVAHEPIRTGGLRHLIPSRLRTRKSHPVPPAIPLTRDGMEANGDRLIRGVAILILLAVAGAAAYVSYHHFYGLAIALGERHDMAILYPAMSDGVIVMASLVMVYCSRRGIPVPVLAWAALALGGVVTLVANVAHGWSGGLGSRLLSALAPVAFVGAYELLMWLVRIARRAAAHVEETPAAVPVEEHVCQPEIVIETVTVTETAVPLDRFEAARLAYEDSLKPGSKRIGWRPLSNRWGIEVQEAKDIIAEVDRERQEQTAEEPAPEPTVAPPVPPAPKADESDKDRRVEDAEQTDRALKNAILSAALNGQHAIPGPGAEEEDDGFPRVLGGRLIDREEYLRTGALVSLNGSSPAGGDER